MLTTVVVKRSGNAGDRLKNRFFVGSHQERKFSPRRAGRSAASGFPRPKCQNEQGPGSGAHCAEPLNLMAYSGAIRRAPMLISPERAFGLLDSYRSRETKLAFGGKILGEEAACGAIVRHVWPETQSIGISLISDDNERNWDRLIPIGSATFHLIHMGEESLFAPDGDFLSVLIFGFPDGTTMFLAEQASE